MDASNVTTITTIRQLRDHAFQILRHNVRIDQPRREAEVLLAHFLKMTREDLLKNDHAAVDRTATGQIFAACERRRRDEPMAYLTGLKGFGDLELAVNAAVLIPRPETELLVAAVADWVESRPAGQPLRILDVGTGSGCIGLALAKKFPFAEVIGIDHSGAAIAVAEKNAERLAVQNCRFFVADARASRVWGDFGPLDVVVSNPPYIVRSQRFEVDRSVRDFEPEMALFCGHADEWYALLRQEAGKSLNAGGLLACEIGVDQGKITINEFSRDARWEKISVLPDLNGILRTILAWRSAVG